MIQFNFVLYLAISECDHVELSKRVEQAIPGINDYSIVAKWKTKYLDYI